MAGEKPSSVQARLAAAQEVDPQVYRALLQARFHREKLSPMARGD
jgi:hypothetical protein